MSAAPSQAVGEETSGTRRCITCRKAPVSGERLACDGCQTVATARYVHFEQKPGRLCEKCGERPVKGRSKTCDPCKLAARDQRHRRQKDGRTKSEYARRKEQGVCQVWVGAGRRRESQMRLVRGKGQGDQYKSLLECSWKSRNEISAPRGHRKGHLRYLQTRTGQTWIKRVREVSQGSVRARKSTRELPGPATNAFTSSTGGSPGSRGARDLYATRKDASGNGEEALPQVR